MGKKKKMVRFLKSQEEEGEDRLSRLSDDLIHKILSFVDAKLAVQTSLLSKRWKLIWTTLPYLNFTNYNFPEFNNTTARLLFIYTFYLRRNRQSHLLKLNIVFRVPQINLVLTFFGFAESHNARELNLDFSDGCSIHADLLCCLTSTSLKKFTLRPIQCEFSETECWDLPALTTLHLASDPNCRIILPNSYFICLPSLQTLLLEGFQLPDSISLPGLTTLHLTNCILPQKIWDFPALLTLKLDGVSFPETKFFSALVSLKNLILFFPENITKECFITCPHLLNLEISTCMSATTNHSGKIIVLAPEIRNFSSLGFFPITFGVSELENVDIKLRGSNGDETIATSKDRKMYYYTQVVYMFPGLSSARILTLDLETIEVFLFLFFF